MNLQIKLYFNELERFAGTPPPPYSCDGDRSFRILKPAAQWNVPGWYNRGWRARHRNPQSTFPQRKVNRD